jgi:hypothetical protein
VKFDFFSVQRGIARSALSRAFCQESAMPPYIAIMTGLLLFATGMAV